MREARQNIVRCVVLEMISQPALQFLHALFEPPAQAIPEAFSRQKVGTGYADFLSAAR